MYLLRTALDKQQSQLLTVLESLPATVRIQDDEEEGDEPTPQAIELVRLFLELLNDLGEINRNTSSRTLTLSANDLGKILSWKSPSVESEKKHPLVELKNSVAGFADELNAVLKKLDEYQDGVDWQEIAEPPFGQADGIVQQFSGRPIFILIDEYLEEEHSNYWASCSDDQIPENNLEPEQVMCDLTELIKTCLPADVNVTGECKRLLHLSASPQSNRERTTTAPCFRTRRVEVEPTTGRPEKKIYGEFIVSCTQNSSSSKFKTSNSGLCLVGGNVALTKSV